MEIWEGIILPYELYHRIKASSEKHGGIGRSKTFEYGDHGAPLDPHGHAWGTAERYQASEPKLLDRANPELVRYLSVG